MSVVLHESRRRPTPAFSEAERRRVAEGFDTAIDDALRLPNSPNWFPRPIGDEMRFVYIRGKRYPNHRKFIIDQIKDSNLAFKFDRVGDGIRSEVYFMRVDERQRIMSRMLSLAQASSLPEVIRLDFGSLGGPEAFALQVMELLRLSPAQEAMVERKRAVTQA